ncbi:hypothetical protein N8940_00740 [Sphingomonadaceae bacterium]|nr:hypothetical protein [Sphingomonadaceae bacterium]
MERHGLLDSATDSRALTLQARLVKDRAKRAIAAERAQLFGASAGLYERAGELENSSYPLINAASLSLFAGKKVKSQKLARQVLDLIENNPEEGETPYWREATRAEAMLLLGHETQARAALRHAITKQPTAWEDHAATIAQMALILDERGGEGRWLDQHRPAASVHFSGIAALSDKYGTVRAAIEQFIDQQQPGFAFGALAAGADLLFAQAFLQHRDTVNSCAELHVVLPFPVDEFRDLSVRGFEDHWVPLYDRVLEQAATVTTLNLDDPPPTLAVEIADRMAMGQTIRNAQNLESRALAVTVAANASTAGGGLRPQLVSWQRTGRPLTVIPGERANIGAGRFASKETVQKLQTLVWIGNGDETALQQLVAGRAHLELAGSSCWAVIDDQADAYLLASKIARSDRRLRVSMLHAILDSERPCEHVLNRAQVLASVAPTSAISTDHCSAMALVFAGAGLAIEEIGELRTAWGSETVWSVR